MRLPPTFQAKIVATRHLSTSVRELTLERVDGYPFEFDAGQWVNLVLPLPEGESRRAYSIASPPNGSPRFDIAVTKVDHGMGSCYLHQIEPGTVLKVDGPQGFFTRSLDNATPTLFIATGTGITPFRSMIHAAALAKSDQPLWILFGNRTEEDLLYRDEFETLARRYSPLQLHYTLSRPHLSWTGRTGYVQLHAEELWKSLLSQCSTLPHVYICGLVKMVGAIRELFRKQIGLPRAQVHAERYD